MKVTGIVWLGVRTSAFEELRHLFGGVMGMTTTRDEAGVTWFDLDESGEIQIYDATDTDHTFFGSAPVVGFMVDDFHEAVRELEEGGIELLGVGDSNDERHWQHFRGPDGNIYEILGPRRTTT